MDEVFYEIDDYTVDNTNGEHLCRCNNCGNMLIDRNPQVEANKYELKGVEKDMEELQDEDGNYYVCPVCHCDDYLTDF